MLIELSEFNLFLFLPLVFPITYRIEDYIMRTFITNDNQLFKAFRYFLSHVLNFIPALIIKLRTKKEINKNKKKDIKIEVQSAQSNITIFPAPKREESNELIKLSDKIEKKKRIKSCLYLILLSAIALFCFYYRYLFQEERFGYSKQSVGIFFEIFDYIGLSMLILKLKLYKHSYISAGIIAGLLLILFIITIFYIDAGDILSSFLFHFCLSLCFGSLDVIGKRYMINYFVSPYYLLTLIGIIDIIALLIFDAIIAIFNLDIEGTILGFKNNITSVGLFFMFILDIIVQWVWILGIWLTVYYLSPNHFFISEYISEYVYYITNAISVKEGFYNEVNIVIFSISFAINFFCCLVFNEVIILNFCGLDYNTKKRINQRVNNDNYGFNIEMCESFDKDEELESV